MIRIFEGATVLITGGASGIGRSLAFELAELKARIIVVDRNNDAGRALVEEMKQRGFEVEFNHVEMTATHEVEQLFKEVVQKYKAIDYVFNCAGIFMAGEIRDTPIENWKKVIDNNIWAVYNATHFSYQAMLPFRKGHIINLASAAGLFPVPIMGIYGSSKFAIVGLSHELRSEAKSFGIKVSVVCPTVVNTPLYDTAIYNKVNKEKALKARDTLQTPDAAARKIIKGVVKNRATIQTAFSTKLGWWLYRFAPSMYAVSARKVINGYRNSLRKGNSKA